MTITFLLLFLAHIYHEIIPKNRYIRLLECNTCVQYESALNIPPSILTRMSECNEDAVAFTDSREKFNSSDAIEDENIPFRRIAFIVQSLNGNEWLIYYEKGGRSHVTYLTYAELTKEGQIKCIYNISPNSNKGKMFEKDQLSNVVKTNYFIVTYNNGKKLGRPFVPF